MSAEGLDVTVNPQGRSDTDMPGFIAYARALRQSRVTLNFTRCNGVPVTQLKTRMLEGSLFGSIVGFSAYVWLLHHVRPALATSYAYVNPAIAVLLGTVVLHERFDNDTWIAMAIILASVVLVTRAPKRA